MFIIAKQSIINIRSDTDLQNAKNLRQFEFRGHGLRITLKVVGLIHRLAQIQAILGTLLSNIMGITDVMLFLYN